MIISFSLFVEYIAIVASELNSVITCLQTSHGGIRFRLLAFLRLQEPVSFSSLRILLLVSA